MKWGKKKKNPSSTSSSSTSSSSSSSSSHSHLISHVFPRSWLSKFKQPREEKPVLQNSKNKTNEVKNEDKMMGVESKSAVQSPPYCGNCKANVNAKEVVRKNVKKVPKEVEKERILQRTYMRIMEATEELHRELDQVERNSLDFSRENDGENGKKSSWEELKNAKIKQVMLKNEKQRKSVHFSRELNKQTSNNSNKVRVRSPRTPLKADMCKIRAIEEMKRAKMKKKAKEVIKQEEEKRGGVELGSFAVVKRSWDPQVDFKESMVEMIVAKGITKADELEELLACYLTLNADEYHQMIVKVFRQVWNELN